MKRGIKVAVIGIIFFLVFFFAPFIPITTAMGHGPDYTALVSPSFAFFQCGDFVGHVGIQRGDCQSLQALFIILEL